MNHAEDDVVLNNGTNFLCPLLDAVKDQIETVKSDYITG